MQVILPPYLLPILRLKSEAYSNEAIARELTLSAKTIETYCKRLRSLFKEAGVWQPHYSAELGLVVCAREYLSELAGAPGASGAQGRLQAFPDSSAELFEVLPDYAARIYAEPPHTDASEHMQWARGAAGQLQESLRSVTSDPQKVGANLLFIGNELRDRLLWADAEPVLRKAEELLGTASNQAASAAIRIAHVQIELGDYEQAEAELLRLRRTYAPVMDPIIDAEWYTLRGWLDYNRGDFAHSEQWFQKCLGIVDVTGAPYLGETAHHFLGRVYTDWGRQIGQHPHAEKLFNKAAAHFDRVYEIHCESGDEIGRAYDFFRRAQMLSAQGAWREAQQLRQQARDLFGGHLASLSVDLEDASLALKDGDLRLPRRQAEHALQEWAQVHKAEDMGDALRILSEAWRVEGAPNRALELASAALCVYPYDQHLSNRRLWGEIQVLAYQIVREHNRAYYERLVARLHERAIGRQRHFVYLRHVVADRNADIDRVFARLHHMALSEQHI